MNRLSDLFNIEYGSKFDLNKMTPRSRRRGGVNFVGRADSGQGVRGTVATVAGVSPYPPGAITVALGGRKALASFVQEQPFYTGQNVAVLTPKAPMTFGEKVFACICIRSNRFRYSTCGREVNRTLRELMVPSPDEYPPWVAAATSAGPDDGRRSKLSAPPAAIRPEEWARFRLGDLFDIRKGTRLTKSDMVSGTTPFIGAIDGNNGVSGYVAQPPEHNGNTITVNYNGSVAEAFYQPVPFRCSDDVNVLYARFPLTPAIAMFLITVIRMEKYRFSFGRKWHLPRMIDAEVRLPPTATGQPDWATMETYVLSLPYSSRL